MVGYSFLVLAASVGVAGHLGSHHPPPQTEDNATSELPSAHTRSDTEVALAIQAGMGHHSSPSPCKSSLLQERYRPILLQAILLGFREQLAGL